MTYWRTYYHLVWSTKGRERVLFGENAETAIKAIRAEALELRSIVHALAVQPEHVHLAVSTPPVYSPAQIAKQVKGKSSHLLTNVWNPEGGVDWTGWQSEYGVITFGERSLSSIVRYITNQEEHHRSNKLWPNFENIGGLPPSPNLEDPSVTDVTSKRFCPGSPGFQPGETMPGDPNLGRRGRHDFSPASAELE
jgi:putative transposase